MATRSGGIAQAVTAAAAGIALLYFLRDILIPLVLALFLAVLVHALDPLYRRAAAGSAALDGPGSRGPRRDIRRGGGDAHLCPGRGADGPAGARADRPHRGYSSADRPGNRSQQAVESRDPDRENQRSRGCRRRAWRRRRACLGPAADDHLLHLHPRRTERACNASWRSFPTLPEVPARSKRSPGTSPANSKPICGCRR